MDISEVLMAISTNMYYTNTIQISHKGIQEVEMYKSNSDFRHVN